MRVSARLGRPMAHLLAQSLSIGQVGNTQGLLRMHYPLPQPCTGIGVTTGFEDGTMAGLVEDPRRMVGEPRFVARLKPGTAV
jgi:hypothetical protein